MTQLIVHNIVTDNHSAQVFDTCALTYDARLMRRKVLTCDGGTAVLVDLEHTTSLNDGDLLALNDGRFIRVVAAAEPLYRPSVSACHPPT